MEPLFGFVFEVSPVIAALACVLLLAGGLAVGKLLWRDDRALMQDRREADDLAHMLSKLGFTLLPQILTDFAIGDMARLIHDIRNAARVFTSPELRAAELTHLLKGLVDDQLGNSKTAQVFVDDVVAKAKVLGYTPSATALGGASDDSLLDETNDKPPVTVNFHNYPTATEKAAGDAATSGVVVK